MSMTFLALSTFADVPYDVSRFVLRLASMLFLTYVLTLVISLILTWRPKRRKSGKKVLQIAPVRANRDTADAKPSESAVDFTKNLVPRELALTERVEMPEVVPDQHRVSELSALGRQK